jgi:crotonobetainyl-CoA:carnitine CoA-transferase CaiB-like acyl-CoA transferase
VTTQDAGPGDGARAGALSGIRVLDFTRVVSGPYATLMLGDLGADVVKVESLGEGDDTRAWGPPWVGADSAYYLGLNRNKRSIAVDLKTAEGAALARELAARSDVVIENFRPGVMDRLGLGYEALSRDHPELVYCGISAFGEHGPYRERPGYDVMISAMGGLMGITGTPGGDPVKVGVALVDVATGLYAALGVTAAVLEVQRTGRGQRVSTSLLSVELAILINAASNYLLAGEVMSPQGSAHSSIVPYQAFRCADDWIVIAAANDRLFAALANALGVPEWQRDERFATNAARVEHRELLCGLISDKVAAGPAAEWIARLGEAGVAVAPVNRMDQVFADPRGSALDPVQEVEHPAHGPLRLVRPALEMSAAAKVAATAPPALGQHTDEVLAELLGLDEDRIAALRRQGAIGGQSAH